MLCPCTGHIFAWGLVHLFLVVSRDRVFQSDISNSYSDMIWLHLWDQLLEKNIKIIQGKNFIREILLLFFNIAEIFFGHTNHLNKGDFFAVFFFKSSIGYQCIERLL